MPKLDETRVAPETALGSTPADDAAAGSTEKPVNEIVKTAQQAKEEEAKAAAVKAAEAGENRGAWIAAGVGVGIGSAALVAALLYANRGKDKTKPKSD